MAPRSLSLSLSLIHPPKHRPIVRFTPVECEFSHQSQDQKAQQTLLFHFFYRNGSLSLLLSRSEGRGSVVCCIRFLFMFHQVQNLSAYRACILRVRVGRNKRRLSHRPRCKNVHPCPHPLGIESNKIRPRIFIFQNKKSYNSPLGTNGKTDTNPIVCTMYIRPTQ